MVSASDMAYAVTALLEAEEGTDDATSSFNQAYDALNSAGDMSAFVNGATTSTLGLGLGLRLSMDMQRIVVNTAVSLVDKDAIRKVKNFRHATLTVTNEGANGGRKSKDQASEEKNVNESETHVFSKPLASRSGSTMTHRSNKFCRKTCPKLSEWLAEFWQTEFRCWRMIKMKLKKDDKVLIFVWFKNDFQIFVGVGARVRALLALEPENSHIRDFLVQLALSNLEGGEVVDEQKKIKFYKIFFLEREALEVTQLQRLACTCAGCYYK